MLSHLKKQAEKFFGFHSSLIGSSGGRARAA